MMVQGCDMQLDTMGVKRKFDEFESCIDFQCYGKQRQSILNITMQKLCTIPERRVEPSLYRNVLIRNTLKHIEQELNDEGIAIPMLPSMDTNFSYHNMESNDCFLDHLPADSADSADKGVHHDIVNSITGLRPLDYTSPEPMELNEAAGDDDVSNSNNGNMSNVRLVNPDNSSSSSVVPLMCSLDRLSTFEGNVSLASIPNSSSPKTDDIFGDIDLSPFDFDFAALANSSSKLTPLSAEEVLHTFPGVGNALSSTPASAMAEPSTYTSLINTQCSSYCRTDVLEDLDNIMQILIEI